ncbi:hypothetical protein [Brachybacterium tyrofermentans]|uniref:hypothetical protein n=1 Tax=Brachybacterium tyrofermentans TaxID=47848 RepID=UPI003FD254D6
MSLDLDPLELLAVALTAARLALPNAFPLAMAAIAAPRRLWNGAGLALGLGILFGVIAAIAGHFLHLHGTALVVSSLGHLLGLSLAVVASVVIVIRSDGSWVTALIGILACAVIGLGEPSQALPALFGLSHSVIVVGAGIVIEAVVIVVVVGALVAAAGRVRALQIGIAAAGAVAAVMIGISVTLHLLRGRIELEAGGVPIVTQLVVIVVVLVIGTVGGAVLERFSGRRGDVEAGGGQA